MIHQPVVCFGWTGDEHWLLLRIGKRLTETLNILGIDVIIPARLAALILRFNLLLLLGNRGVLSVSLRIDRPGCGAWVCRRSTVGPA